MDIDFAKHADRASIPVQEPGTYKVKLDKWEKCIARTGTEQIRWYATIAEGEHQGDPLIDHLAMSEAAGWRIAWFTKEALGFDKEAMKAIGKLSIGGAKFNKLMDLAKGRTMFWSVTVDSQYGNNKVTEYIDDADQVPVDPEDAEDVPAFLKEK